jgi:hypothetical protein
MMTHPPCNMCGRSNISQPKIQSAEIYKTFRKDKSLVWAFLE